MVIIALLSTIVSQTFRVIPASADPRSITLILMNHRSHWESVWAATDGNDTSWYQREAHTCTELVRRVTAPSDKIAVVGAGTSTLITELLVAGYRTITAVDISQAALDRLSTKLGDDAAHVQLIRADVCTVKIPNLVDLWHDRATFHFLTDSTDQSNYAETVTAAVRPGGHMIIAAFGDNGPDQCSGLPVSRHSRDSLDSVFGSGFELIDSFESTHITPWGTTQQFTHALMRSRLTGPEITDTIPRNFPETLAHASLSRN